MKIEDYLFFADYPGIGKIWVAPGTFNLQVDSEILDLIDFIVEGEIAMRDLAKPVSRFNLYSEFIVDCEPALFTPGRRLPGGCVHQFEPYPEIPCNKPVIGPNVQFCLKWVETVAAPGPFKNRSYPYYFAIPGQYSRYWNFGPFEFKEYNKGTALANGDLDFVQPKTLINYAKD